MSAAGSSPHERFNQRVDNYAKYRPGYPAEVFKFAAEKFGLTSESVIADIGAGTGIFSRLLLERGYQVVSVEPNAEMRAAAERDLADFPRWKCIAGSAEATSLADQSVDLITAAQAFHWFDLQPTRREFARILRPQGWVLAIWNERKPSGTPFLEGYERLLQERGVDYPAIASRTQQQKADLKQFFDAGTLEMREFESAQSFDEAGLIGRALSSSYVPGTGDPRQGPLLDALRQLFERTQVHGFVSMDYVTRLYFGRVTGTSQA